MHFFKFEAIDQADQHIILSQKNYICHGNTASYGDGIRTFHKNFENVEYCLPSNTFKSLELHDQIFNGTLKVRRFMILQAYKEKLQRNGDDDLANTSEKKQNGVNY